MNQEGKRKSVYVFSGLGADQRVFQYIDFSDFDVHYISWNRPSRKESIEAYAKGLLSQIKTDKPVLLGLSFGGMLATEVAKLIHTEKVILISSCKTRADVPFYFRIAGWLGLLKIVPARHIRLPKCLLHWYFGVGNPLEKKLLAETLKDTDPVFLSWALIRFVGWANTAKLPNLLSIHGTADRMLPIRFANPDIRIAGGSHFMIVSKAPEISAAIRRALAGEPGGNGERSGTALVS